MGSSVAKRRWCRSGWGGASAGLVLGGIGSWIGCLLHWHAHAALAAVIVPCLTAAIGGAVAITKIRTERLCDPIYAKSLIRLANDVAEADPTLASLLLLVSSMIASGKLADKPTTDSTNIIIASLMQHLNINGDDRASNISLSPRLLSNCPATCRVFDKTINDEALQQLITGSSYTDQQRDSLCHTSRVSPG